MDNMITFGQQLREKQQKKQLEMQRILNYEVQFILKFLGFTKHVCTTPDLEEFNTENDLNTALEQYGVKISNLQKVGIFSRASDQAVYTLEFDWSFIPYSKPNLYIQNIVRKIETDCEKLAEQGKGSAQFAWNVDLLDYVVEQISQKLTENGLDLDWNPDHQHLTVWWSS